MTRRVVRSAVALSVALVLTACSGGDAATPSPAPTSAAVDTTTSEPPLADSAPSEALPCDDLDLRDCLLPWPNDLFTVADPATSTGRRLAIDASSTPTNVDGVHVDVTDQNRADGFSPGSAVLAFVPGLDPTASGIAPSTDVGASLSDDAPVVLIDTADGTRVPYWGELDAQAPEGDRVLMIRPAISLTEGHHYAVVLRDLVDTTGEAISPTAATTAALADPGVRGAALRHALTELETWDVDTSDMYLAWDFTVASVASLSTRALHVRDTAYTELGDGAPTFRVTASSADGSIRRVDGSFDVPNFLTGDGSPGSRFVIDDAGLPTRDAGDPTMAVPFHCVLPAAPPSPVPVIIFGHGLLGDRNQVEGLSFAASLGVAGACAIDEIGMSTSDLGNLALILSDLSHFPEQADRMVQGLLNQQFLGRLLNHPAGFVADPAFRTEADSPIVAVGATQFVGNSQGGILGGAMSAVSTEWSRVVLGVPGLDYSLLLTRSSDWPEFQAIFDVAYTDPAERVIALQLIQLLWDRGENDGYAQHLTDDPYPGITAKQVLLVGAFGDHQVANVATYVLARTIGASVHTPVLAAGRSPEVEPAWAIPALDHSAPPSAALVMWDYATPPPPTVNLPPTEPEYGNDPHGSGSDEPAVLLQALTFLLTGELTDPCSGAPCTGSPA